MSRNHECKALDEFVTIDGTTATLVGDLLLNSYGAKLPIVAQPAGGYAVLPGGATNYINLGAALKIALPSSICAWIYIDNSLAAAAGVFMNCDSAVNAGVALLINSTPKVVGKIGSNTGNYYKSKTGATTIPKGEWHHIAAVLVSPNPNNITVYYDGNDDGGSYAGTATSHATIASNAVIGRYMTGSYFFGYIDEVMFFSDALSGAEVSTIYGRGRNAGPYSDANLIGYWRFDDATVDDDLLLNNGAIVGTVSVTTETYLASFECKDADGYRQMMAADFLVGTPVEPLLAGQKADQRKRLLDLYRIGMLRKDGRLNALPRIACRPGVSFALGGLTDWTFENLLHLADQNQQIRARIRAIEEKMKK